MNPYSLTAALLFVLAPASATTTLFRSRAQAPRDELAQLAKQLNSSKRSEVLEALGQLVKRGSDAAPVIAKAWTRQQEWVRMRAYMACSQLGAAATGTLPKLCAARDDAVVISYGSVASALQWIEAGEQMISLTLSYERLGFIDAPERDLNDVDAEFAPFAWMLAISTVGAHDLGKLADEALAQRRLERKPGAVLVLEGCFAAACARAASGGTTAVETRLASTDSDEASLALAAVVALGDKAAELAPKVVGACSSEIVPMRVRAIEALAASAAKHAEFARAPLETALKDAEPLARLHAALGVARVFDEGARAGELLLAALDDRDATVRAISASGLARVEPPHAPAFDRLLACLADGSAEVRRVSASALARYPDKKALSVKPLTKLLKDAKRDVRTAAERALRQLGEKPNSK